jgi:redox-sensitive bicupin YhaK (pirin superfamily)
MFAGGMQHTDNLGNKGTVHGGGAQRFTAGRGLVHSEMPEGHAAGIQLWINLPRSLKGVDAEYQQVQAHEFTVNEFKGGSLKSIVGEGGPIGLRTEVEYLDVSLDQGETFERAIPEGMRGLIYIESGSGSVNGKAAAEGAAAFVESERSLTIVADTDSRFMWCFGKPHGEPIYQHGPFVD